MALPPVFAASALYDNLLQSALRQFFGRATFETEPIPSLSSDGRLAIEPTQRSVRAVDPLVRVAAHPARARAPSVHPARSPAGEGDRQRARAALPGDLRPQADARAGRPLPRRDRRPLHQRVPERAGAERRRARARRPGRDRARDPARRGALELREQGHLLGRAARRRRGWTALDGGGRAPPACPTNTRRRSPASRASTASATGSRRCFSSTATAPCSTSWKWRAT